MMDFSDTPNRYILVAVIGNYEADEPASVWDIDFLISFKQICKGIDILYYRISGTGFFTTIHSKTSVRMVLNFLLDSKNGSTKKVVLPLTNGICRAPNDNILVNKDSKIN
uniref:Secreted protein n=1 Tax=Strongyloides venezuelensis TaxID=75913 RepID=A0A0K0FVZ0_STRVS